MVRIEASVNVHWTIFLHHFQHHQIIIIHNFHHNNFLSNSHPRINNHVNHHHHQDILNEDLTDKEEFINTFYPDDDFKDEGYEGQPMDEALDEWRILIPTGRRVLFS